MSDAGKKAHRRMRDLSATRRAHDAAVRRNNPGLLCAHGQIGRCPDCVALREYTSARRQAADERDELDLERWLR